MKVSFSRAFACGLLAVVCLFGVAAPAWGQAEGERDVAAQVRQLEAEIAEEQRSLETARQRWSQRERELRERRAELAERIVDAHEEAERLAAREARLEQQRASLADEVDALRQRRGDAVGGARALAEQALIAVEELPGEEEARESLRGVLDALETDDSEAVGAALVSLIETVGELYGRGTAVTLREAEVWTADGSRERVTLLTAGHVAFAYRSADGDRVALALGSPAEASGYRWVEDLPEEVERGLREAFAASEDGEAVSLPMDVSGELRVESVTHGQTWADVLRSGGMIMFPLAFVAAVGFLLILERMWVLYGRNGSNERLVGPVVQACAAGEFAEAERLLGRGRGVVARTLAACLRRRKQGVHAVEDSIQEQLLHELPRLQRFLGGIAILAAVAPLLGLLGTVTGIIETFGVIRAFGNASPGLMAGGISEALVTTATGLTIAIPILLLHAMLRGRVDRIVADAERHAATLLNTLATGGGEAAEAGEGAKKQDAASRSQQEVGT